MSGIHATLAEVRRGARRGGDARVGASGGCVSWVGIARRRAARRAGLLVAVAALGVAGTAAADDDFNGDGAPDVVVAINNLPNRVWLSDGVGGFRFVDPEPAVARTSRGVAVGDLNGDCRMDAYFVGYQADRIWFGDGAGGFVGVDPEPTVTRPSYCVALGDLDSDGDLDAVVCQIFAPDRVLLNDGAGNFTGSDPEPDVALASRRVALGDLNGDGHLDAVFAVVGAPDRLWLGDGRGGFTGSDLEPDLVRDASGVAIGDLDGDGDQDIVIANRDQPDRVFLNDGHAVFTAFDPEPDVQRLGKTVALGDLNGDGHLDVVFTNGTVDRIWLGDGAGGFTGSDPEPSRSFISHGVALADLDRDGDLDAVFTGTFGGRTHLWTGDGAGGFVGSDPDPVNPDGGEEVAILPLLPQPVKRARSFLAPVAVRAKAGKRLTVRADIDLGPDGVDLAGGATIRCGELQLEIPAFAPNGSATRWTYASTDKALKATVRTDRAGGSSKARLDLTLNGWDETLPVTGDGDELLGLGFATADVGVAATVHLTSGVYRSGRGEFSGPPLTVSRLRVTAPHGRAGSVSLTAQLAREVGEGVVAESPELRLVLGSPGRPLRMTLSQATHDVRSVPGGFVFTPRADAPDGARATVSLDFARRRVRVALRGALLGRFPGDDSTPFVFGLSLLPRGCPDAVEVQARKRGSRLTY